MDPAVVVVLLIVGAFVAIIAVQAGTGAVIETAFDKAGRVLEDRSKPKGTFVASLSIADVMAAGREAAAEVGAENVREPSPGELAITFPSGVSALLSAALQQNEIAKVKVGAAKASNIDGETMSQFLGAVLASLRRRDPTARQAAK
jgi:hypothetical protein